MFGTNTEPSAGNDGRLSRDFPELPVSAETNREKGDGIYDELVGTFLPKATKEVGPSIDVSGELVRCRHSPVGAIKRILPVRTGAALGSERFSISSGVFWCRFDKNVKCPLIF